MHIGLTVLFDGKFYGPEHVKTISQSMEAAGFASIWLPEHVVVFDDHNSTYPYPPEPGSPLAPKAPIGQDQGIYDPLIAALAVTMHTTTLRAGTSVALVNVRHPLVMAKEIATLDALSGGRFDFGVGVGWLREEYEALNVPFEKRGKVADEFLAAIRAVWTERRPTFHGEYVNFDDVVSFPKPVQSPHPPILVGGESDPALRRVARYGDGWYGWNMTIEQLQANLGRLDGFLAKEGRERKDVIVQVGLRTSQDLATVRAYADQCQELGVHQVVASLRFPPGPVDEAVFQLAEGLGVRSRLS